MDNNILRALGFCDVNINSIIPEHTILDEVISEYIEIIEKVSYYDFDDNFDLIINNRVSIDAYETFAFYPVSRAKKIITAEQITLDDYNEDIQDFTILTSLLVKNSDNVFNFYTINPLTEIDQFELNTYEDFKVTMLGIIKKAVAILPLDESSMYYNITQINYETNTLLHKLKNVTDIFDIYMDQDEDIRLNSNRSLINLVGNRIMEDDFYSVIDTYYINNEKNKYEGLICVKDLQLCINRYTGKKYYIINGIVENNEIDFVVNYDDVYGYLEKGMRLKVDFDLIGEIIV